MIPARVIKPLCRFSSLTAGGGSPPPAPWTEAMCGRYTFSTNPRVLAGHFALNEVSEHFGAMASPRVGRQSHRAAGEGLKNGFSRDEGILRPKSQIYAGLRRGIPGRANCPTACWTNSVESQYPHLGFGQRPDRTALVCPGHHPVRNGWLDRQTAEFVVTEVFQAMAEALIREKRIELRDFGSLKIRKYKGYTGRNPKAGK